MDDSSGTDNSGTFVSAREVAQRAGVSRSAVSRAFTPGASISPETRDKVMQAAEELGYQVNDLARGLLARRSRLVGLIISDLDTPLRAAVVDALSSELIQRGNIPTLVRIDPQADRFEDAQRTLLGLRAEAVIVLSGSPPAQLVELARRNGQPLIALNRGEPFLDRVRINNTSCATEAVDRLVKAGCSNLGLINSSARTASLMERERAFVDRCVAIGLPVTVVREGWTNYEGGCAAAKQMLKGKNHPDGLFCINDLMAFGVIDHARTLGLSVPNDLCVIGFDDVPQAQWGAYNLSTFRQDPILQAKAALSMLDQRIAAPSAPPFVTEISGVFVARGSVRQ